MAVFTLQTITCKNSQDIIYFYLFNNNKTRFFGVNDALMIICGVKQCLNKNFFLFKLCQNNIVKSHFDIV